MVVDANVRDAHGHTPHHEACDVREAGLLLLLRDHQAYVHRQLSRGRFRLSARASVVAGGRRPGPVPRADAGGDGGSCRQPGLAERGRAALDRGGGGATAAPPDPVPGAEPNAEPGGERAVQAEQSVQHPPHQLVQPRHTLRGARAPSSLPPTPATRPLLIRPCGRRGPSLRVPPPPAPDPLSTANTSPRPRRHLPPASAAPPPLVHGQS